ncbi:carbohydrate ABC transporter permease [Clostridium butyricum]|uniref:ABC transporter, permease protein n=1 Tax=Clostridium butyricum E4 str. BoNT E BL5262 TaxID=632245 RepID=C4IH95_CLOBU|nr:carbohydrate ABC transporter permease [Clostridium butyricum]APF22204.1 binding--dependent transport system inner membrane component family protein [Clostridium butyricum]EDT75432.1 sugar ABC transporter [Clostridium butyricum 5521]EEP53835.1 ABC transporter, permease protein [Clostridium butyricum E4 str. BoNT E BL5262]NFL30237.1 carbohydrate ABC transporter permease [Clostridium butyricum]NFS17661.1 carbohydrate ABC transporter permease [Clostridium butyricum]
MAVEQKNKKFISKTLIYTVCFIMAFIVLMPLYLVLLNSFKTVSESAVVGLRMPEKFLFENYPYVIQEGKLIKAFFNSVFITGSVVIITVLLGSLSAFVIARRNDKITKFASGYFLIGLVAPIALIPEVAIIKILGLSGTYLSIILIHVAVKLPLSIMLYIGFIKGIPNSLDEAAMIDGCSPIKLFFKIIFPLLKPATFTNIIIIFMGVWNDFQISLYFITDGAKNTLPMSIYSFVGYMTYKWNYVCAFIILTILPIIVIYVFAQKYIVDGMIAGSVK